MTSAAIWNVQLAKAARKSLERLPAGDSRAVLAALDNLARDPFNATLDTKRLKRPLFGWRLRVRDYRVLYDLDLLARVILVARIERRTTTTYR